MRIEECYKLERKERRRETEIEGRRGEETENLFIHNTKWLSAIDKNQNRTQIWYSITSIPVRLFGNRMIDWNHSTSL